MGNVRVKLKGFETKDGGYFLHGYETAKATLHIALSDLAAWLHIRCRNALRGQPFSENVWIGQMEIAVPMDSLERQPRRYKELVEVNADFSRQISFDGRRGWQIMCSRGDCPFHVPMGVVCPSVDPGDTSGMMHPTQENAAPPDGSEDKSSSPEKDGGSPGPHEG